MINVNKVFASVRTLPIALHVHPMETALHQTIVNATKDTWVQSAIFQYVSIFQLLRSRCALVKETVCLQTCVNVTPVILATNVN